MSSLQVIVTLAGSYHISAKMLYPNFAGYFYLAQKCFRQIVLSRRVVNLCVHLGYFKRDTTFDTVKLGLFDFIRSPFLNTDTKTVLL